MSIAIIGVTLCLLLSGCVIATSDPTPSIPAVQPGSSAVNTPPAQMPAAASTDEGVISSGQAEKIISEQTAVVITALKNKDMKKLQAYVHPDRGVRFSPYTHVDKQNDIVIKAGQLESLFSETKPRTWGHYDGSGEPITLTFADYFNKFVYNHDFARAEKISYNETLGKGNTVNNIREVYPNSIVVEYYFSGFDKSLQGMDWASLRLIYERTDNRWYLTGIVHDQWTI